MKVIQVEKEQFDSLFDEACKDLLLGKCMNENGHYNSDAEYKSALSGMHRRFVYTVRTLHDKLEKA